jgi:hypothetical protein
VTILTTDVQVPANLMVSDGTLLFWTTFESALGLFAMPVQGGAVTTLLSGQTGNSWGGAFLAVDDLNVYVLAVHSLLRLPKNGAPPTLINEAGATVVAATSLGGTVYWVESIGPEMPQTVKSAPTSGNLVTTLGTAYAGIASFNTIAVTSSTVFLGVGSEIVYFPTTGVPSSGPTMLTLNEDCGSLSSDTAGVYCPSSPSNWLLANNGASTPLGQAYNSSFIVSDDTNVYWVDQTTVGTIETAAKVGGGSATVLAHDTSPTAIAVDAHSIYWSDQQGYIKKIPK